MHAQLAGLLNGSLTATFLVFMVMLLACRVADAGCLAATSSSWVVGSCCLAVWLAGF
jgi:hypothetical protein